MADRYWVGGTANWDATAGTKWATTSGGAGGQAVPTSADDVYFDANSGAVTVTVSAVGFCRNLTTTGFTGTLAGGSNIRVNGSLLLSAGMTFTHTGFIQFTATSGSYTVTTAGKTLGAASFSLAASTAVWTLQDALTCTGGVDTSGGTFTTNDFNVTASSLLSSNSNTRTINLGSSTVTLSGGSPITFSINTNLTFNAGTSTISMSATDITVRGGAQSGQGVTFYNLSFTSTSGTLHQLTGRNTTNNLAVTAPTAAGVRQFNFDDGQTINGTLSTTGTAGNRRVWFRGLTYGIAQTLTINSAPSLTDADFRDIYVIGTAAPISGTRIGDLRGIRGITADAPKTVYWNLAGAQNWSANGWSDTSTGTPSTDFFPLAQDIATFTNAGLVTGAITMNTAVPYTGTVDMSGRTSAMTLNLGTTLTIYGDWINGSGTTIGGSNTVTFSGRNIQTKTSAGKAFPGGLVVDTYGGTFQLADALTVSSASITVTNGTFDTKNYNVTAVSLSSNNSNVRAINLGSSTLTFGGQPITFTTSTNLSFNAGTSTIISTPTSPTFNGGGNVFYNVSFTATGSFAGRTVNGANTFNNLSFSAPASSGISLETFSANQTINGTLTVAGATAVRRIFLRSDTLGTTRTLTVGTLSATDCDFRDITIAGTAAGGSPTRAGDCGGNTGITFPAAKTVYWNLAGAQNWSAIAWAATSGGSPDINNFPLAQDAAVFDDAGAAGTVSLSGLAANIGTFDASLRTSAMTVNLATCQVYGDWKHGSGLTFSAQNAGVDFLGNGVIQTITSNGVSFGGNRFRPSTVNGGKVILADAFTATGQMQFISGEFDANNFNVTLGGFEASSTILPRILRMGSGLWTMTGASPWTINSGGVLAFYKGTANILLSNTSTSARYFGGGNLSYNKLTIGGATGISTTTIDNNNQFTELASTKTVAHTIALGTTTQTFGAWTVTGTAGNVVTLTGTGTSHILAGACTSGIDYLAMGSIGFAATSPGEFYAGANSTGTAAAPVYRTAKPADSTRYWVGGTGNWSDTARWSTSSGGAGGASVPRSHDDVIFDSASNATAYTATVNAVTGGIRTKALTVAGPASGNLTLAGSTAINGIHGNVTLPATGLTRTYTGAITLSGSSAGRTLTTNGQALSSPITVNGVGAEWTLGSALSATGVSFTVTNGAFDTANFNLTCVSFIANSSNARTVSFGSSTLTLSGSASFGTAESIRASLTFNAGTSQIDFTGTSSSPDFNNQTLYNVSFTNSGIISPIINGSNTFNNLTVAGRTSAGIAAIVLSANQTINGTLTLSAGTNATMRTFVQSNTLGTTRTLTCAAVATPTDIDFRDIIIAGAAAPVSGTRLGDCKGNSGITFDAAKTVYLANNSSALWSSSGSWALSSGGAVSNNNFPLAQDNVVVDNATLPSGSTITINAAYNIGSIDMSARTSNTMTLATGSTTPTIYGNWINGTGTTLTGTGTLTFAGRGSQTITSAGVTFTLGFRTETPSGSVALQDALTASLTTASAFVIAAGTFDANGYNVTFAGGASSATSTVARTVAVGSGTFVVGGTTGWNMNAATNLTVTGTGTISLTSASAKTFAGGGANYSGITLDQGGAGTLTITGNNTFANISNTYSATGATTIAMGTTTQTVGNFTASGEAGRVLTVQGTSATSPATLILTSGTVTTPDYLAVTGVRAYNLVDTWYAGANSTNNGSLGWYFSTGLAPTSDIYYGSINVTAIFYGSTPVTAIYYGATQVF